MRLNKKLYRAWIKYLCVREGIRSSTADIRATAFLRARDGTPVPKG